MSKQSRKAQKSKPVPHPQAAALKNTARPKPVEEPATHSTALPDLISKAYNLNYNPDVLTCLANLSNDEVFTPPELANRMLDLLPAELWRNPNATFLDPVTKSGIFLREIAKRLNAGLAAHIPDAQQRINHIFTKQLFGIAITELTALLARRSLYCAKLANSPQSICTTFAKDNPQGNILYHRTEHRWHAGKCRDCGASEAVYDRDAALETHAYPFIHTDTPQALFGADMRFDVIIGNPPYQLNDGGGTGSSAKPIYHLFIEQAKKLNPNYLSMIIPARWYSGGKGLDDFRECMLNDTNISTLVDYADSRECFPSVDIAGGICYFLRKNLNQELCEVTSIKNGNKSTYSRRLNEFEVFVRDNLAVEIIHKIQTLEKKFLNTIVSSRMPFGIVANFKPKNKGELSIRTSSGSGYANFNDVTSGNELINKWKVLLSKASNDHGGQPDKEGKRRIFSKVEVIGPRVICSESYLVVGSFDSEVEATNLVIYLKSKFSRFLVSTVLLTQNITKSKFAFVPIQDFSEPFTDEKLYAKYGLTTEEIAFIESMIRPMDLASADVDTAAGDSDE